MSAKEMRKIADDVRRKATSDYIAKLKLLISARANDGFVDITVDNIPDNVIRNIVAQWLNEQGYRASSLGTTFYTIEW